MTCKQSKLVPPLTQKQLEEALYNSDDDTFDLQDSSDGWVPSDEEECSEIEDHISKRTLEEALQIAYVDEENNSAPIEAVYIKPPEVNVLTDEESGDEETDLDLDRLSERQLRSQAEIKLCHNKRIHNAHQHLEATTSKAITSEATTSIIENKLFMIYPKISPDELKCFTAILILSGYDVKPGKRFYWDIGLDMGNPLVKNCMRRNRFEQIMWFCYLADNSQTDENDES
ncbi:transposase is4 [Holotrichia oblita]|uniref:Transposase is4 n=1 Tax=Holotrichia oblita TaxID=644536 RepID=A0ACB9STW0_HOLOL|nr:transposase is4 [Holotrichia oblita]